MALKELSNLDIVSGAAGQDEAAHRFQQLTARWKAETLWLSSLHDICMHPSYQQIIGMGPVALPFILQALQAEPDHWFWALRAITGENPIPTDSQGNVDAMRTAWLKWACQKGLLV